MKGKTQLLGVIELGNGYVKRPNTIRSKSIPKTITLHGGEFSAFAKHGRGYWETLGDEDDPDANIHSEKQLEEVCKKKGLTSRYLEDKV